MRRFRDVDGDTWTEQRDGSCLLTESADQENRFVVGTLCADMDDLAAAYGPLTELDPSPTDLSAPATRGDIVRVLEALSQAAFWDGFDDRHDLFTRLANEIKEGRA